MSYRVTAVETSVDDQERLIRLWLQAGVAGEHPELRYEWFYCRNPEGEATTLLLDNEHAETIGSVALGPRCWWLAREEVAVGVLADLLMSAPQGIEQSSVLLRQACERGQERFSLIYGFPNAECKVAFRRAGYQLFGQLVRYGKVLRSERYLQRRMSRYLAYLVSPLLDIGLWIKDGWQILRQRRRRGVGRWIYTFDARFDRLWQRVVSNNRDLVLCKRSAEYLRWRFSDYPQQEYRIFVLSPPRSEEILGYVVCYVDQEQVVHIIDILAEDFDVTLATLLGRFIRAIRKQDQVSISMEFYGLESVLKLLEENDFIPRHSRPIYHVWSHAQNMREADGVNWFVTSADEDQ